MLIHSKHCFVSAFSFHPYSSTWDRIQMSEGLFNSRPFALLISFFTLSHDRCWNQVLWYFGLRDFGLCNPCILPKFDLLKWSSRVGNQLLLVDSTPYTILPLYSIRRSRNIPEDLRSTTNVISRLYPSTLQAFLLVGHPWRM
jgi:hypothetical protein